MSAALRVVVDIFTVFGASAAAVPEIDVSAVKVRVFVADVPVADATPMFASVAKLPAALVAEMVNCGDARLAKIMPVCD